MTYSTLFSQTDWDRIRELYDSLTIVNKPSARYLGDGIYSYHELYTPIKKKKELLDEDECI